VITHLETALRPSSLQALVGIEGGGNTTWDEAQAAHDARRQQLRHERAAVEQAAEPGLVEQVANLKERLRKLASKRRDLILKQEQAQTGWERAVDSGEDPTKFHKARMDTGAAFAALGEEESRVQANLTEVEAKLAESRVWYVEKARRAALVVAERTVINARHALAQAVEKAVLVLLAAQDELDTLRSPEFLRHLPADDEAARSWTAQKPPEAEYLGPDLSSLSKAAEENDRRREEWERQVEAAREHGARLEDPIGDRHRGGKRDRHLEGKQP
jgi:hypothetical protein